MSDINGLYTTSLTNDAFSASQSSASSPTPVPALHPPPSPTSTATHDSDHYASNNQRDGTAAPKRSSSPLLPTEDAKRQRVVEEEDEKSKTISLGSQDINDWFDQSTVNSAAGQDTYPEPPADPTCAVCREAYGEDDEEVMGDGTCAHTLHKECADLWVGGGRQGCPLCAEGGKEMVIGEDAGAQTQEKDSAPLPPASATTPHPSSEAENTATTAEDEVDAAVEAYVPRRPPCRLKNGTFILGRRVDVPDSLRKAAAKYNLFWLTPHEPILPPKNKSKRKFEQRGTVSNAWDRMERLGVSTEDSTPRIDLVSLAEELYPFLTRSVVDQQACLVNLLHTYYGYPETGRTSLRFVQDVLTEHHFVAAAA
ncbi:hypothetical protein HK104_009223, partial [Borealophlyctis nickersoniae]